MGTIRVSSTGTVEQRLLALEQATNYEEEIVCVTLLNDLAQTVTSVGTSFTDCGGLTIPWDQFQPLLPNDRWALSAAGWLVSAAVDVNLRLAYTKDDASEIVLGQTTIPAGPGLRKTEIGPYPARGDLAPTVPLGEAIPSYKFGASLAATDTAVLFRWTMWLRMTPRHI
jgi:uncharacterized protein (DUF2237 family)